MERHALIRYLWEILLLGKIISCNFEPTMIDLIPIFTVCIISHRFGPFCENYVWYPIKILNVLLETLHAHNV